MAGSPRNKDQPPKLSSMSRRLLLPSALLLRLGTTAVVADPTQLVPMQPAAPQQRYSANDSVASAIYQEER